MLFNTLSILAVLPAFTLALPTPHGSIHRRNHRTIHLSKKASKNLNDTLSGLGEEISSLFPAGKGSAFWSTATGAVDNAVELSNEAFNPTAMLSRAKPSYDTAPDGSKSLRIHFDKGAYDYKGPEGGISFYAKPIDLSNAKEVTYSYSLYFSKGFAFNKGGKLPGMYGGDNAQTSISCSGGRRDVTCWSARFMFRTDGAGELYTYLPQPDSGSQFSGNKQLCNVKPLSDCNDQYGASVARGSWKWKTGDWTTVSQRIKLNDAGQQNGEMEVIVDGNTVINLKGLAYRDSDKGRFQGVQMQSFFGGHDPSWASHKDQDIWTKDYSIAVTQEF